MIELDNSHFQHVAEYPCNLPTEFCKKLIENFEKDKRRTPGITSSPSLKIKESIDLCISDKADWSEEHSLLSNTLLNVLKPYLSQFHNLISDKPAFKMRTSFDCFQIQRTDPGSIGYKWHTDTRTRLDQLPGDIQVLMQRRLTYIWYLNDDFEEGETEFCDFKIKPEAGKLLVFPADLSYLHRGVPPKNGSKYILTGWMSQAIDVDGV